MGFLNHTRVPYISMGNRVTRRGNWRWRKKFAHIYYTLIPCCNCLFINWDENSLKIFWKMLKISGGRIKYIFIKFQNTRWIFNPYKTVLILPQGNRKKVRHQSRTKWIWNLPKGFSFISKRRLIREEFFFQIEYFNSLLLAMDYNEWYPILKLLARTN